MTEQDALGVLAKSPEAEGLSREAFLHALPPAYFERMDADDIVHHYHLVAMLAPPAARDKTLHAQGDSCPLPFEGAIVDDHPMARPIVRVVGANHPQVTVRVRPYADRGRHHVLVSCADRREVDTLPSARRCPLPQLPRVGDGPDRIRPARCESRDAIRKRN